MGTFSIWHWLIVLVVVVILFGGGGKLSRIMGDLGSGLKNFKKNVKDETANAEDSATKREQIDEKSSVAEGESKEKTTQKD